MSWKVVITSRGQMEVGQASIQTLREAGCEVVPFVEQAFYSGLELRMLLAGADAVVAGQDIYDSAVFAAPETSGLKIVSRWGVGYDNIDVSAASAAGVVVAYTPGILDETVADLAFALLLGAARRVHHGHLSMLRGEWRREWATNVFGKTLGIVGCGRIGQAVARRAGGFSMRVLGYDVHPSARAREWGIEFVEFEELLRASDFVSLHAALTPQNRGLIGAAQLRIMKPGAFLINTARGALVDEAALLKALDKGQIAGAALDAFAVEPLAEDHPLRKLPNVLLTPHQASYARETGERVSVTVVQSILDLMEGRHPALVVNPEVFDSPRLRAGLTANAR